MGILQKEKNSNDQSNINLDFHFVAKSAWPKNHFQINMYLGKYATTKKVLTYRHIISKF